MSNYHMLSELQNRQYLGSVTGRQKTYQYLSLPDSESLTNEELASRLISRLSTHHFLNTPVRQCAGDTYYFSNDGIYSLDAGSKMFPYQRIRCIYTPFLHGVIWSHAAQSFQLGMSLKDCLLIYLDTKIDRYKLDYSFLARLVTRIERPEFERTPDNKNRSTFDFIRVEVNLGKEMFPTWEALKQAVQDNKKSIDEMVLQKIAEDRKFNNFNIPISFLRVGNIVLRRNYTMEYTFELKRMPELDCLLSSKNKFLHQASTSSGCKKSVQVHER